jgi:hypothetical protein
MSKVIEYDADGNLLHPEKVYKPEFTPGEDETELDGSESIYVGSGGYGASSDGTMNVGTLVARYRMLVDLLLKMDEEYEKVSDCCDQQRALVTHGVEPWGKVARDWGIY